MIRGVTVSRNHAIQIDIYLLTYFVWFGVKRLLRILAWKRQKCLCSSRRHTQPCVVEERIA